MPTKRVLPKLSDPTAVCDAAFDMLGYFDMSMVYSGPFCRLISWLRLSRAFCFGVHTRDLLPFRSISPVRSLLRNICHRSCLSALECLSRADLADAGQTSAQRIPRMQRSEQIWQSGESLDHCTLRKESKTVRLYFFRRLCVKCNTGIILAKKKQV